MKSEPTLRKIPTLTSDCPAHLRQAGQKSASRILTHVSESPPSADKPAKIFIIKGGR